MPHVVDITHGRSKLCQNVLDDLPEWFGIPEAKAEYVAAAGELPMLACLVEGKPAGVVVLRRQTEFATELFVLAVKRAFHRRGVGRALVEAAARAAGGAGCRYLTVKTLAASHPDSHYAGTRRFYEAVGFVPVEVFPTLWGAHNPCLLMIKALEAA